eukprot:m.210765 g.210765  ORF g.210765 m.210765 type:complete len:80 (+) comp19019_c0_seq2:40-279(+)
MTAFLVLVVGPSAYLFLLRGGVVAAVKLPAMMEYAGVSPKGACYLVTCLQDILEYLHAHKDKFFATDAYITHSPPSGKK